MNALPLLAAAVLSSFTPGRILHAQEPAPSPKTEQPKSPVQAKAENLILDRISFAEADITDVLDHIGKKSRDADAAEKSGLNLILNAGETKPPAVTMDMNEESAGVGCPNLHFSQSVKFPNLHFSRDFICR